MKATAQLLTPEQCADFLQVAVNTLYVMKSQGRIPHRKVGGRLRFDLTEIVEWTKRDRDTIRSPSVAATKKRRDN